jgi:CubicO group peptidase (beta-lactamase class C family)
MRPVLFLALAACATPHLRPAAPLPAPERFDAATVDAYLSARAAEPGMVGLSVAVVRDGQVVLARGYGKRSLAAAAPVTAETRFAIGSVSKQLTAAGVLLLQEDGKLSVRDPVAKYLPDLTAARDVTLYDLLTHVSGYPDYYPLDFVDRRMQAATTPDEILRRYAMGPVDFAPGARWSYSNTNYVILGRIVEKVSGEPLDRFLTRRILEPLGMTHTSFGPPAGVADVATGYVTFALGPPEVAVPEGPGWLFAAGA